jgi:hypothetical protein
MVKPQHHVTDNKTVCEIGTQAIQESLLQQRLRLRLRLQISMHQRLLLLLLLLLLLQALPSDGNSHCCSYFCSTRPMLHLTPHK